MYEGLVVSRPKRGFDGDIFLEWKCPKIGYGEVVIYWDVDGELCYEAPDAPDELVAQVLAKAVPFMVRRV